MRCEVCGQPLAIGDTFMGRVEVLGCDNGCDPDAVQLCPVAPCEMAADHDGPHVTYVDRNPTGPPVRVEWDGP